MPIAFDEVRQLLIGHPKTRGWFFRKPGDCRPEFLAVGAGCDIPTVRLGIEAAGPGTTLILAPAYREKFTPS